MSTLSQFIQSSGFKSQTFLSSGTWIRPTDVNVVSVMCVGGGGSGAVSIRGQRSVNALCNINYWASIRAGGGGEIAYHSNIRVTGNVSVTIGAGGMGVNRTHTTLLCTTTQNSGSSGSFGQGNTGGNTTFSSHIPLIASGGARGFGVCRNSFSGSCDETLPIQNLIEPGIGTYGNSRENMGISPFSRGSTGGGSSFGLGTGNITSNAVEFTGTTDTPPAGSGAGSGMIATTNTQHGTKNITSGTGGSGRCVVFWK